VHTSHFPSFNSLLGRRTGTLCNLRKGQKGILHEYYRHPNIEPWCYIKR